MDREELVKALGPLGPFCEDDDVSSIFVDGPQRVCVERQGRLERCESPFADQAAVRQVIDDVLALAGEELSSDQTTAALTLPDRGRFIAAVPPTATSGPCLAVRLGSRRPLTWEALISFGAITAEARDLLAEAVAEGVGIVVAGGRGSGKTTVANLIADLTYPEGRVLVCERAAAMRLQHPGAVYLEAGGPGGPWYDELLETGVELMPDLLAVGELRGSDGMAALEVMGGAGIRAGLATLHATGIEDALSRLDRMCLAACPGLALSQVRELVAAAVGLITYQCRLPDGLRVVTDIVELAGVGDDGYKLEWLFRLDPGPKRLVPTGASPSWHSD